VITAWKLQAMNNCGECAPWIEKIHTRCLLSMLCKLLMVPSSWFHKAKCMPLKLIEILNKVFRALAQENIVPSRLLGHCFSVQEQESAFYLSSTEKHTSLGFMVCYWWCFRVFSSFSLQMTDNDNSHCDLSFVLIFLITCCFNCLIELPFVLIFLQRL